MWYFVVDTFFDGVCTVLVFVAGFGAFRADGGGRRALVGGVAVIFVAFETCQYIDVFLYFALVGGDSGIVHGEASGQYVLRYCCVCCYEFNDVCVLINFGNGIQFDKGVLLFNICLDFVCCARAGVKVYLSDKYGSFCS